MSRNVLHAIEESMPSFSKGQKRIAGYILEIGRASCRERV